MRMSWAGRGGAAVACRVADVGMSGAAPPHHPVAGFLRAVRAGSLGALSLRAVAVAVLATAMMYGATAKAQPAVSGGEQRDGAGVQGEKSAEPHDAGAGPAASAAQPQPEKPFDIDEFRVEGADALAQIDVETAVYPFLGPGKTKADVEKARAALEKAYHDKGLQTVAVSVPPQPQENIDSGFVVLRVAELKVGRINVKGSRYFDIDHIKRKAPSVAEGALPNFNAVTKDIIALNQWPDRRVSPSLRAGATPGTVDVDLNVEDKLPVHASLEVNNRRSASTTSTRISGSARYDNLWQLGHSVNLAYQVAPERPDDVKVFSGSYLARHPSNDFLGFLVYGVKSDSSIATVGDVNVTGPGEILGARAIVTLPGLEGFFHTLSVGLDYKHFGQVVNLGTDEFSSPVTYVPWTLSYGATWKREKSTTELNLGITSGIRGLGSDVFEFDNRRYKASTSFTYLRGDISHTYELPGSFQLFAKLEGQIASQALVSSEEFAIGGYGTVRGYLESQALGDNGAAGTVEIRSPDLAPLLSDALGLDAGKSHAADAGTATADTQAPQDDVRLKALSDWRIFAFYDAGYASIYDPPSEQETVFRLASYGIGTRITLFDYLKGDIAWAVRQIDAEDSKAGKDRFLFRVWSEF